MLLSFILSMGMLGVILECAIRSHSDILMPKATSILSMGAKWFRRGLIPRIASAGGIQHKSPTHKLNANDYYVPAQAAA